MLGGDDEAAVERLAEQGEHVVPSERRQPPQHGEEKSRPTTAATLSDLTAGLRSLPEAVRDQLANAVGTPVIAAAPLASRSRTDSTTKNGWPSVSWWRRSASASTPFVAEGLA